MGKQISYTTLNGGHSTMQGHVTNTYVELHGLDQISPFIGNQ